MKLYTWQVTFFALERPLANHAGSFSSSSEGGDGGALPPGSPVKRLSGDIPSLVPNQLALSCGPRRRGVAPHHRSG